MTLKYGSKSNSKQAVRAYRLLMGFPVGDDYSIALQTATKNFQKEHRLKVDGKAGPETLTALAKTLPAVKYKDYSGSVYVQAVQALVSTAIDGKYGNGTRKNVIAFQTTAGLNPTGNVETNDWLALFGCSYEKTAPATITPAPAQPSGGTHTKQPVDYKQGDSRWGKKPYTAYGNKNQTIANSGCGPTSMADIMATWVDKNLTPVEMCKYAIDHGFRTKNSGTAWGFFKSIAAAYGFTKFVQTKSMATAKAAIKAGCLVVASMGPGYWTKGGHYICLWKCDDTYMYANDPASKSRKKQKLGDFEEQRKQFFIFYPFNATEDATVPFEQVDDGKPTESTGSAIIDISKWQGGIDFDALKPNVGLVIARASCGSDRDIKIDEYATAMQQRGIPFGVYCYSYARDVAKAQDEARKIVQYAGKYNPAFYVMDAEEDCIKQETIKAFAEELRKQGAKCIGCYVANHRYKEYGYAAVAELFDFTWIPRYSTTPPAYACDLWQYTSKGSIPGIKGNVDMNKLMGDKTLEWFQKGGEV